MATGVSGSGSNCNSGGGELMKAVVVNETTGEIEYIEDYVEIPDNSGVSHEVEVVSVDDFRRRLRNPIVHPHQNSTSTTQSIVKPLVSTLSSPPSGAGGGGSGGSGSFQVQLRNTPSLLRNSRAAARNLGQAHHGHVQSHIPAVPVPVQLPVQIQSQSQQQQQLNQLQIQQQLQLQQVQHQTQQAIQQIFEFLPVIQQGGGQGLNSIQSIQLSSPSVLPPASAQFLRTFETGSGGSSNNVNLNLDSSTINQLIVYNCGDNQYELLPGQDSILDNGSGSVQLRLCEVIQTEGGDHEIVEGISVLGEDGSTQFQTADGNTIYICSEPQEGDEDDSGEHEHQTYAVPVEDVEEYEGIQIVDHDMPILQDEDGNIYEVQGGHESLEMEFPVPMPIPNKRRKKMGGPARTLGVNAAARVMTGKSDSKASSVSSSHHVPVSLKVPKKPLNELKCLEMGCPFAGVNVSELRKHLCAVHFFTFDEEVIMFPSDKDFKSWRETYERERMVSFIFRGGTKKISRDQAVTYLICHRSGHYKPTMKDQSLRKRKMKPQGSCKMNGYCTAGIKLLKNLESGEVRCEICHTHYGHPLDNGAIPHLRVNNILRKIIRKKFEEGMSFNQVVQYLHHNPDHLEGLRLLDRRAVRNIYDKFRKNPKEFFDEDSNEIDHLFEHDLDIKSPVDSDGDDIGNDSLTITSIQDSDDTGPPKSSFVLQVINESAASSPTVEDQDMDVKPSINSAGKIGLRLFRPSQELQDVKDKEEVEIASKSEQILPDNENSESSGIVSVSNSNSNVISEDTKILNSTEERKSAKKNVSRQNSVSSEESSVRKSRSRSTNESNDESILESIDAVVNNIQTNYEHEATSSPQPESLAKLSPETETPISPKKRGRKPKTAKTSADNLNNSLSETDTSMGDTPRRSGRERKPKLFHDDQEYDARFHGVKIKVETESGSTSSISIAPSEKEKEVKILPPSSPKKKSAPKTKESAPKSPTKYKLQSNLNSNIASHHLVPLTLEPPTLEKNEISVPSKSADSNNDVPSPSESLSTDGDNLPPILKSIVDQEANENSADKSNSEPPSLSPFPAAETETTAQAESEGKLQPYNQIQVPEYSGSISATVSQSSLSSVKTEGGKNKKNTTPLRKSQIQSEEKQLLQNSKTANPKPKPKPKSVSVKLEPSLNTTPNSISSSRRKPKETVPKVVVPPAEIISEELKSTIQGMLKHGESGPTVLLYKLPGTLTPECGRKDSRIHKDDFILIIQTPVQRQLMQMFSDVINIDGHKGRPKDLKLMWVIVLDEFREAIPVAWLISNSTEPRMVSIFLRVLHAQCGDIQTNYLMAPLCTGNEYCSLWASVFKPPNQKVGGSGSGLPQLILNEEETKRDMRIEVAETFPDTLSRRKLNTCMNQLMWAVSKRQFEAAYKEMKNFLESQHEEKGLIFFRNFERNWILRANEWNLLHRIGSPVNTLYASDSFGKLKKFIAFKGTRILNSCIDPVLKIGYDKCFSRSKRIFKGDQKLLRTMEEIEMQHGWGTEIDPDNFVLIRNEGENQAHAEEDGNGNCESPESEYLKFRFCVKDPEKNTEYFVFNTQCPCRCKYICSKCEICVHQFICTCPLSAVEHQMCSHIHFVQIMTQIQQSQSQKSVALFAPSNPIIHEQQVYHIQLDNMDVSIQEEDDGQNHELLRVGESENMSDNEQNENMDTENEECDVPTVSENESECEIKNEIQEVDLENEESSNQEVKNETQEVDLENEDSSNQVTMVGEVQEEEEECLEEVQEDKE